jgi:hypothetical protein
MDAGQVKRPCRIVWRKENRLGVEFGRFDGGAALSDFSIGQRIMGAGGNYLRTNSWLRN